MDRKTEAYLWGARRLGDRLLERAERDRHGLFWRSLWMDGQGNGSWRVGEGLYAGNAGIALFFAELSGLTGDEAYREAAAASLTWLAAHTAAEEPVGLGGFSGRTSTFFPLLRFAAITGETRYLDMALAIGRNCWDPAWREWPDHLDDLLSGKAGALLAFLHLHAATGEAWILEPIDFLIGALLDRAHPGAEGFYWDHNPHQITGLCGFSHGAAGIGFAFTELGYYFGNETFHRLADSAFAYEDFHFREHGNWPDFRKGIYNADIQKEFLETFTAGDLDFFKRPTQMDMWCHGSVGVGLSRLGAFVRTGEARHRQALEHALDLTRVSEREHGDAERLGLHMSLCHGRSGNRDFLLEAGRLLGDADLLAPAFELGDYIVTHLGRGGAFPSGYPNLPQSDTSLFMGDAGIGYFLLRLAAPERVPCILAPRLAHRGGTPIAREGFHHIDLNLAGAQRRLLARVYGRTLAHLDRTAPEGLAGFFAAHRGVLDVREPFAAFVSRVVANLEPEAADALRALYDLESARYAHRLACESCILVHVRGLDHVEKLHRLNGMAAADLLRRRLVLNPDAKLIVGRHRESGPARGGGQHVLLVPVTGETVERRLSPMSHLVLTHFGEPATVARTLPAILAGIDIRGESQRARAQTIILDQIRQELRMGCLHLV